ncbi:hypothetical protein An16g02790 [Aspergillus niger]|uniref:Uncharacterized protein n=2 Tax=Aspergillus niger TaxID=5061 RepID=A2R7A0_ASPNC|nr:hypothetical protein An16g02790 [Aspergillus niger]CAK48589.1 hypothetical protein An16g02790 [Aspergillus niger]
MAYLDIGGLESIHPRVEHAIRVPKAYVVISQLRYGTWHTVTAQLTLVGGMNMKLKAQQLDLRDLYCIETKCLLPGGFPMIAIYSEASPAQGILIERRDFLLDCFGHESIQKGGRVFEQYAASERHSGWERNPPIDPGTAPHLPVPKLFFFLSLRDRSSRSFGNDIVLASHVLDPDGG